MSRIGKDGGYVQRPDDKGTDEVREGGHDAQQSGALGTDAPARRQVSAADAERLVSQAGFMRTASKKKGGGLDLGESKGPIPLPDDDVDASEWSTDVLAQAQAQLLQHNAKVGKSRGRQAERGLLGALLALSAGGGDEDPQDSGEQEDQAAKLRAIVEQAPPDAAAMAQLAQSIHRHFGVDVGGAPVGEALMATSLLVAGHAESVVAAGDGAGAIEAAPLLGGLQQVIEEGRSAADDARQRSEGVSRTLAMQRTFVPRR